MAQWVPPSPISSPPLILRPAPGHGLYNCTSLLDGSFPISQTLIRTFRLWQIQQSIVPECTHKLESFLCSVFSQDSHSYSLYGCIIVWDLETAPYGSNFCSVSQDFPTLAAPKSRKAFTFPTNAALALRKGDSTHS